MISPIEVSVLIPVHATKPEHIGWLREAVESARAQDYPVAEIVVCDDASTVPITGIQGCRMHRMERHQGVCAARNFLGANCVTPWLVFLDADDKLYEGALRKMVAQANPMRAVYGNLMLFGNGYGQRYYSLRDYDGGALLQDPIMPITSLHTRAAFERVGGFDPAFEDGLEEWDYNIRLMLDGVCGHQIHEPLLWYRRHADQRSHGRMWLRDQMFLVRDRYKALEGMEMGCCGGRNRPRARNNPHNPARHLNPAEMKAGEMVLIAYTGKRMGSIVLRGRETGTSYRFGGSHRERYVWPGDAKGILELPGYRIVRREPRLSTEVRPPDKALLEREAAQPPRMEPGRGRPSAPDDLTVIKGLGKARVAKLAEAGITRFQHLAVSNASQIASIVGVAEHQAEEWIKLVREVL